MQWLEYQQGQDVMKKCQKSEKNSEHIVPLAGAGSCDKEPGDESRF